MNGLGEFAVITIDTSLNYFYLISCTLSLAVINLGQRHWYDEPAEARISEDELVNEDIIKLNHLTIRVIESSNITKNSVSLNLFNKIRKEGLRLTFRMPY